MEQRFGPPPVQHRLGDRVWYAKQADMKVRRVCTDCNSGWLATLEARVQRLLAPLILGKGRLALSTSEQKLITRWGVKTATMVGYSQSPPRPAPPDQLAWLRERGTPPPQTGTWLAAYRGEEQSTVRQASVTCEFPGGLGQAFEAVLTTFVHGPLVVLVLHFVDAPDEIAVGTYDEVMNTFTTKLWPRAVHSVTATWPPKLGCDDDGLDKLSSALENDLIQLYAPVGRIRIR
jgi:hypothetical protein